MTTSKNNNTMLVGDFLVRYWVIIVAVVTMSTAWGATQVKINTLESAIKASASTQKDVQDLKTQAAVSAAQTADTNNTVKQMQEMQQQQQILLQQILINMPKGKGK